MIRNYLVTGNPPFILGDEVVDAGKTVQLPVQIADDPVARGALVLAHENIEAKPSPSPEPAKPKAAEGEAAETAPAKAEPKAEKTSRRRKGK